MLGVDWGSSGDRGVEGVCSTAIGVIGFASCPIVFAEQSLFCLGNDDLGLSPHLLQISTNGSPAEDSRPTRIM